MLTAEQFELALRCIEKGKVLQLRKILDESQQPPNTRNYIHLFVYAFVHANKNRDALIEALLQDGFPLYCSIKEEEIHGYIDRPIFSAEYNDPFVETDPKSSDTFFILALVMWASKEGVSPSFIKKLISFLKDPDLIIKFLFSKSPVYNGKLLIRLFTRSPANTLLEFIKNFPSDKLTPELLQYLFSFNFVHNIIDELGLLIPEDLGNKATLLLQKNYDRIQKELIFELSPERSARFRRPQEAEAAPAPVEQKPTESETTTTIKAAHSQLLKTVREGDMTVVDSLLSRHFLHLKRLLLCKPSLLLFAAFSKQNNILSAILNKAMERGIQAKILLPLCEEAQQAIQSKKDDESYNEVRETLEKNIALLSAPKTNTASDQQPAGTAEVAAADATPTADTTSPAINITAAGAEKTDTTAKNKPPETLAAEPITLEKVFRSGQLNKLSDEELQRLIKAQGCATLHFDILDQTTPLCVLIHAGRERLKLVHWLVSSNYIQWDLEPDYYNLPHIFKSWEGTSKTLREQICRLSAKAKERKFTEERVDSPASEQLNSSTEEQLSSLNECTGVSDADSVNNTDDTITSEIEVASPTWDTTSDDEMLQTLDMDRDDKTDHYQESHPLWCKAQDDPTNLWPRPAISSLQRLLFWQAAAAAAPFVPSQAQTPNEPATTVSPRMSQDN